MVTPSQHETLNGLCVHGELPGPRSAELLARQSRREVGVVFVGTGSAAATFRGRVVDSGRGPGGC